MAQPGYRNLRLECAYCPSRWVAVEIDWNQDGHLARVYRCRMCHDKFVVQAAIDIITDPKGRI